MRLPLVLQARTQRRSRTGRADAMGYQPTLDGIRAIAVVAVLLYHADFGWIPGGFLGVDVFFVVSGYLITSLLIEERRGSMTTDLKQFWLRRAKRLLPALFAMLIVTCFYAAAFVPDALYRLRTDVLAAATYSTNWWLIASHQSYFEALGPPAPPAAPLVPGGRGAVVPGVAARLRRGDGARPRPDRAPRRCRSSLVALASAMWMAIIFDPAGRRLPGLLRHRQPGLGAAHRRRHGDGVVAVAVAPRRSLAPPRPGRRRLGGPRSSSSS